MGTEKRNLNHSKQRGTGSKGLVKGEIGGRGVGEQSNENYKLMKTTIRKEKKKKEMLGKG